MRKGVLAAIGAYLLWGFLPVYWKLIRQVPAPEILGHRIVWSLLFALLLLLVLRHWGWIATVRHQPRLLLVFAATGSILAGNWLIYIWAVNNNFIVEASLGYFINPLVNVLLGVVFLKERLRPLQWVAILVALAGVAYLTVQIGSLPWISLTLAFSFGVYGLIRKTAALASLEGLSLEMSIVFLPALAYLFWLAAQGQAAFGQETGTSLLLALAGLATALPLLLFAYSARLIPLSTIGILQYIAPTLQFLLGVLVYHEPFSPTRMAGFLLIWTALLIYTLESLWVMRRRRF